MNKYKVCVYAICKNERHFVDSWMDSMDEADLVVVTDTGSEDGTQEKLKERGAVVYEDHIEPWRFDTARNISLDHVPEDVDICVCTDLDERFEPGWRECLEKAWAAHEPEKAGRTAKSGKYLYNWRLKEDGTPDVQFYYFKVHERHDFRWKCPVHEFIQYAGSLPYEIIYIEGMVLSHYPDIYKSRGTYLPLLEMAVKEDPQDERMRCYLGREYMYRGEWEKCRKTLTDYLSMPSAVWRDERSAAMRWIAKAHSELGNVSEAYSWYYRAIGEMPDMRDPYVEFAQLCCEQKDWPMTLFLTEEALKIKEKSKTYVNMGYAWDYTLDDLCAMAAYWMKLREKALEHARNALFFAPEDERLRNNLKIIESASLEINSSL